MPPTRKNSPPDGGPQNETNAADVFTQDPDGLEPATEHNQLVRNVLAGLGNVAFITALLVYFGWLRSEIQAREIGIDESILGMSTQEYVLRSVRPVLVLLIVVAVAGLAWIMADRWLLIRLLRHGPQDRYFKWATWFLPLGAILLLLATWSARALFPAAAYIAFPLCVATVILLSLYTFSLRQSLPGAVPMPPGRQSVLRLCVAAIVGIAIFASAANYATVEGVQLGRAFAERVDTLPRVVVYSAEPMHIDAPGVQMKVLGGSGKQYRYTGLRLLERTGGKHFLVSDGWTRQYGVVIVLVDDANLRLEFVRATT